MRRGILKSEKYSIVSVCDCSSCYVRWMHGFISHCYMLLSLIYEHKPMPIHPRRIIKPVCSYQSSHYRYNGHRCLGFS